MTEDAEQSVFAEMIERYLESEDYDTNTPYTALQYLQDLQALSETPPDPEAASSTWFDQSSGHTHILRCPPDNYYFRLYQCVIARHGKRDGMGRGIRACAMVSFFHENRARLDASGLNWLDLSQPAERRLKFLTFLLRYPIVQARQFSPDAIPPIAIDEFLSLE